MRRDRGDQPGRAVFAGCADRLSPVPGLPLWKGSGDSQVCGQGWGSLLDAGADGHGHPPCAGGFGRAQAGQPAAGCAGTAGAWLSDAGGGDAQPLRRGGAAAEAGQRNGAFAGGRALRVR